MKNKAYQKHLTFLNREDIEKFLKAGFKFYQIANQIQKDATTIFMRRGGRPYIRLYRNSNRLQLGNVLNLDIELFGNIDFMNTLFAMKMNITEYVNI